VDQTPTRVLLVLLPPGERRLEFAEPMGTPAVLSTRIAELLPGTTFDADRRGTFRRGGYEITFDFVAERTAIAQATGIEVTVVRGEGFAALKRIVEKTGWQAVDPATLNPIDFDKSRATGAVAVASAGTQTQAKKPTRTSAAPSPRVVAIAAVGVVVIGAVALAAWSMRGGGLFSRGTPFSASELAAGPPSYAHLPAVPRSADAEARRIAAAQFVLAADEVRGRLERLRELAPEFRSDEIVHQLMQFRDASIAFPAKVGENGFMSPERLSDAPFFAQLHAAPRLPAWFAEPQRDGYVFEFAGDDCTWRAHMVELGTLCFGFTYSARPVDASSGKRSFALFSADQRIHYRSGGAAPAQSDPTVDTNGASVEQSSANEHPAMQEAYALRDLRQAASAEFVAATMIGRGYINPERLAEEATYLGTKIPAMLPGYFMQTARQGYKFDFAGVNLMRAPTPFGGAYESFVYSASPQDPRARGSRSFALYPDGKIYATSDRRVPTRQDALVASR
jgi:hypothetical protein